MTPAQIARRRRFVEASQKRHAPRKIPRAQQPTGATLALTEATLAVANDLDAAFREALADEGLAFPRSDAADGDAGMPPINTPGLLARLRRLAERVVKARGSVIDDTLTKVGAQVASFTRDQFQRQVKLAMGVDLTTLEPNLAPAIKAFRREHTALIKSMAADKVDRVRAILTEAGSGTRVETIRNQLMEESGVSKRQASLIARDQVLSLNASVTRKRHEAAGITEFIWRTSGDASVRKDHRRLEGKRFRYDDPPVVNASEVSRGKPERREIAGHDYQCRCTCEPWIEGFDEDPAEPSRRPT